MEPTNHNAVILGLGTTGQSIIDFLINNATENSNSNQATETATAGSAAAIINPQATTTGTAAPGNVPTLNLFLCDDNPTVLAATPVDRRYAAQISRHLTPSTDEGAENFLRRYNIDTIYCSPGIPYQPQKKHHLLAAAERIGGIKVVSDIDLFYASAPQARYIGVTGTNGKSTAVALLHHAFSKLIEAGNSTIKRVFLGGNFGTPLLSLPRHNSEDTHYTLALSSYHKDMIRLLKLEVAACLNITEDHLDRYGTLVNYIIAKNKIFTLLKPGGRAVIGEEMANKLVGFHLNPPSTEPLDLVRCQAKPAADKAYDLSYDILSGIRLENLSTALSEQQGLKPQRHYQAAGITLNNELPGIHNAENTAACLAIAAPFGISEEHFLGTLSSFKPLPHRMQPVGDYGGLSWINDSKATNIGAAAKALSSFDHIHWIVGGQSKNESLNDLAPLFSRVVCAYLIGNTTEQFAAILEGFKVPYIKCYSLEQAMDAVRKNTKNAQKAENREKTAANVEVISAEPQEQSAPPSKKKKTVASINNDTGTISHPDHSDRAVVLLSPACASTDQWKNFEERGRFFQDVVQRWLSADKEQ